MIGDFNAFKKRQKSDESNKSSLRNKIRTKKKGLIDGANYSTKDEFNLPEVSKAELEKIKSEIRKKVKKEKRIRTIVTLIVSSIIIAAIFLLIKRMI